MLFTTAIKNSGLIVLWSRIYCLKMKSILKKVVLSWYSQKLWDFRFWACWTFLTKCLHTKALCRSEKTSKRYVLGLWHSLNIVLYHNTKIRIIRPVKQNILQENKKYPQKSCSQPIFSKALRLWIWSFLNVFDKTLSL